MRFSYAESMTEPSFYPSLARAAEEAGYDSMIVPDSICYPRHSVSTYPFSPDGSREFLQDKPFLEPFSLIPALGAVTTRLRFVTFVLKLPVRDPALTAKQATSTAVLTGGRLVLGAGTSPWREDYEVLGIDWASRGRRMDESIAILRGLAASSCSTLRSYAEVWPRARASIRCGGYPSLNSGAPSPRAPSSRATMAGGARPTAPGPPPGTAGGFSETAGRAGISPQYLSEIERGRKEPSSEMIAALAGALGTTLIQLTEQVADDLRRQQAITLARASAPRAPQSRAAGPVLLSLAA